MLILPSNSATTLLFVLNWGGDYHDKYSNIRRRNVRHHHRGSNRFVHTSASNASRPQSCRGRSRVDRFVYVGEEEESQITGILGMYLHLATLILCAMISVLALQKSLTSPYPPHHQATNILPTKQTPKCPIGLPLGIRKDSRRQPWRLARSRTLDHTFPLPAIFHFRWHRR